MVDGLFKLLMGMVQARSTNNYSVFRSAKAVLYRLFHHRIVMFVVLSARKHALLKGRRLRMQIFNSSARKCVISLIFSMPIMVAINAQEECIPKIQPKVVRRHQVYSLPLTCREKRTRGIKKQHDKIVKNPPGRHNRMTNEIGQ